MIQQQLVLQTGLDASMVYFVRQELVEPKIKKQPSYQIEIILGGFAPDVGQQTGGAVYGQTLDFVLRGTFVINVWNVLMVDQVGQGYKFLTNPSRGVIAILTQVISALEQWFPITEDDDGNLIQVLEEPMRMDPSGCELLPAGADSVPQKWRSLWTCSFIQKLPCCTNPMPNPSWSPGISEPGTTLAAIVMAIWNQLVAVTGLSSSCVYFVREERDEPLVKKSVQQIEVVMGSFAPDVGQQIGGAVHGQTLDYVLKGSFTVGLWTSYMVDQTAQAYKFLTDGQRGAVPMACRILQALEQFFPTYNGAALLCQPMRLSPGGAFNLLPGPESGMQKMTAVFEVEFIQAIIPQK